MKLSKTLLAIACFALVGVGLMPPASAYTIEEVYNGTYSLNVSVDSFSFAKKRCIKWKTKTPYLDGGQSFGSSWYNSDVDNCPDGMIRLDGPQQGHKSSLRGNSLFFEMQYSISRVAVYRNDEALRVFRTYLKTDGYTQKIKEFNIPSRAGYSYTSSAGKTYVLTHFFVYDNQFILYDPVSRFSLSFLGERVIENGIILANPGSDTDNLRMINLQKKKAWSMTTTATNAYKWLMGQDVSNKRIQSLEWNTSYSIIDGGNSFLPSQFFNDKQGKDGGLGFIYNEDLNFIAPSWQSESNNSDPLSTGSIVKKYNNCSEYWTDIKSLAIYSERCGNDASDDTTSNWVKVDSWNGEGDVIATLEEGGNKNKCGRFANAKKKYKEKYKDNFDSFYSDFSNYAFSSDALNISAMCKGVELDQEHGSAGADPTSKTPFTNWVLENVPGAKQLNEFFFNPIANIGADGVISILGKKDTIVCSGNGYSYTASDVDSDVMKLRELNSQCKSNTSCSELLEYQALIKAKYLNCKDETFYIRNHIGDLWNDKFFGMGIVDNVINFVVREYNKGKNDIFPVYYCSSVSPLGGEYDKMLWVLFLIFAFLFYRILR